MMQRFLGWDIGHRNRANFPHEAHDLVVTDADRELQVRPHHDARSNNAGSSSNLAGTSAAGTSMQRLGGIVHDEEVDEEEAWQGLIGDDEEAKIDTLRERLAAGDGQDGQEEDYDFDEGDYEY